MPSRLSGSASTSIDLKGTPISFSTCTVAAEKPHIGKAGVPFMYTTILLSRTSRSISSITSADSSDMIRSPSRRSRAQRERVDAGHELAEGAVHQLVLLDERLAREGGRAHFDLEVVTRASRIGHRDARTGQRHLDRTADLFRARHNARVRLLYVAARPSK